MKHRLDWERLGLEPPTWLTTSISIHRELWDALTAAAQAAGIAKYMLVCTALYRYLYSKGQITHHQSWEIWAGDVEAALERNLQAKSREVDDAQEVD